MFNVTENIIEVTRGDTAELELDIKQENGSDYIRADGDVVIFTVKRSTRDLQPLIQKIIPADNIFKLNPEDTVGLDYGTYFYDVQVTLAVDRSVNTIITPSPFIVKEEVTF